jgi:hypothetical protein
MENKKNTGSQMGHTRIRKKEGKKYSTECVTDLD